MKKQSKFTYLVLDLLALLLVGGLLLVHQFHLSAGWQHVLQIGVILVGYGLIALWSERHPTTPDDATTTDPAVEPGEAGCPLTEVQLRYRQAVTTKMKL